MIQANVTIAACSSGYNQNCKSKPGNKKWCVRK